VQNGLLFPRVMVAHNPWRTRQELPAARKIPDVPMSQMLCDHIPNGAWQGQRCFIVAGGPSLKGFDFSRLRGELVIGINRAFERIDPAFNFSMDTRFLRWLQKGELGPDVQARFRSMRGTKVWMHERSSAAQFPKDVLLITTTGEHEFSACLRTGFGLSNNSGFGALNLAVALGASPIYLLGFDMGGRDHTGEQDWWHSGYPRRQSNHVYSKFRDRFMQHAGAIHESGCRVINLNRESGLRCFEFGDVETIEPPPERPLVIAYYTKGTGYEAESRKMVASAHRMGLECEVDGIETRGGWQSNTYYKAEFIRQKMQKHPDRPLLWLDVDVEVKRYPSLFDNQDADFCVNVVDWSRYKAKGNQKELNTSVLYIRPSERTFALMDAWIARNNAEIDSGRWEQRNLQDVLEKWTRPLSVRYLPDAYCQIFDLMASNGDPVIELHQASRALRSEVGA
jgi:hypothetical protein